MPVVLPQNTTRKQVRHGIAAYLGGTYVQNIRAYQHGPLLSFGLSTVKSGFGKRLNFGDFVAGQMAGRGMGAMMIVELPFDRERRRANAGAPQLDAGSNIVAGGIKFIWYRPQLSVFHLAQQQYAEDAADDIEDLIEGIKQQIRVDRTLGGICTDAGNSPFGIQTRVGHPGVDGNERTSTWFQIEFELLTQIIA